MQISSPSWLPVSDNSAFFENGGSAPPSPTMLPPQNVEAEQALLGTILIQDKSLLKIVEILSPDDFYRTAHKIIFEVMVKLFERSEPHDLVTMTNALRDQNRLEQVGGSAYLVSLTDVIPFTGMLVHHARIIREKSILRKLIETSSDVAARCYDAQDDLEALIDKAEQTIFEIAQAKNKQGFEPMSKIIPKAFLRVENLAKRKEHITGISTGYDELDRMTAGLQPADMIVLAGRPSMGKAQPLEAKVLTLQGFKRIKELEIGDQLASIDGKYSHVVGVYPQGKRQVYTITFADGRSTKCCAEHLWKIHYRNWSCPRIVTTARLMELLERKRYQKRMWIDTFSGNYGSQADLPIDPWLLGVLIGDGSLSCGSLRFSTTSKQMLERVKAAVGSGMEVKYSGQYDYRIIIKGGAHCKGVSGVRENPLVASLQELGVWNCRAEAKFIPSCYLQASRQMRLRLLAGLLDSDGWVEKFGAIRFCTCSRQLAEDTVSLVRSLGGIARFFEKKTIYTYRKKKYTDQIAYTCNLQIPDAESLSLLEEKQRQIRKRQRIRRLNVISIIPYRITETQCIAVSHPSQLYITDDYIVTHNTALAMNIVQHAALINKVPVAVFSLEMSMEQLALRMLCSVGRIDSQRIRTGHLQENDWHKLNRATGMLADSPIFIDDTAGMTVLEMRAKARRLKSEHNLGLVVVDYLQLMQGNSRIENRTQEISDISRSLKAMAKELDVPVIALSQLNRSLESRTDKRPQLSDLRESGAIEQDADVIMFIYRDEVYNKAEDNPNRGIAELIVGKQRNGPIGTVKLTFLGHITTFESYTNQEPPMGYE
ncbi:MAG: replicative DNA helicase [Candidatus Electrothrix sp. AW3_4]|nr:replicative DNA helicase [Candidatus Electrothrix gigas]